MHDLNWRKTDQFLMPVSKEVPAKGMYDLYPTLKIEDGKIGEGFESLAEERFPVLVIRKLNVSSSRLRSLMLCLPTMSLKIIVFFRLST